MRLKDIIGLLLALILAIGVAFLTRFFLTSKEKSAPVVQQAQPVGLAKILIAEKDLHVGDKIKAGDLNWVEWPEKALNSNYIKEGTVKDIDLIGAIVRGHIEKGEPVTSTNLVKPGDKGILAAILSPGKRAVSIDVTAQSASSGLIAPGDYVDVILSKSVSPPGGTTQYGESKTIASNVKVLAIDIEMSDAHEKPKNAPRVATLEVTPAQAGIISAAVKEGTLNLSLHSLEKSPADEQQGETDKRKKEGTVILMRGKEKTEIQVQEK